MHKGLPHLGCLAKGDRDESQVLLAGHERLILGSAVCLCRPDLKAVPSAPVREPEPAIPEPLGVEPRQRVQCLRSQEVHTLDTTAWRGLAAVCGPCVGCKAVICGSYPFKHLVQCKSRCWCDMNSSPGTHLLGGGGLRALFSIVAALLNLHGICAEQPSSFTHTAIGLSQSVLIGRNKVTQGSQRPGMLQGSCMYCRIHLSSHYFRGGRSGLRSLSQRP